MRWIAISTTYLFHPLMILCYGSLLLWMANPYMFGSIHWGSTQQLLFMKLFFTSALFPALIILVLVGIGFVPSLAMPQRQDRYLPLIGTMLFYIWLYVNLQQSSQVPDALQLMTLGSVLGVVFGFIINVLYKISFHALGAGALSGMVSIIGLYFTSDHIAIPLGQEIYPISSYYIFLLSLLLGGWICSCRILLKAHNLTEVYTGWVIGFICQWLAFLVYQMIALL